MQFRCKFPAKQHSTSKYISCQLFSTQCSWLLKQFNQLCTFHKWVYCSKRYERGTLVFQTILFRVLIFPCNDLFTVTYNNRSFNNQFCQMFASLNWICCSCLNIQKIHIQSGISKKLLLNCQLFSSRLFISITTCTTRISTCYIFNLFMVRAFSVSRFDTIVVGWKRILSKVLLILESAHCYCFVAHVNLLSVNYRVEYVIHNKNCFKYS